MMLGKLELDVMGLAETFLQQEEEIEVGGYTWHGQNRQNCKGKWRSWVVGKKAPASIAAKVSDGWSGMG